MKKVLPIAKKSMLMYVCFVLVIIVSISCFLFDAKSKIIDKKKTAHLIPMEDQLTLNTSNAMLEEMRGGLTDEEWIFIAGVIPFFIILLIVGGGM